MESSSPESNNSGSIVSKYTKQLPDSLNILKKLEQKGADPVPTSNPGDKTSDKPARTHLFNVIPWTGRAGVAARVILFFAASILALLTVYSLMLLTTFDTQFFKLSLTGYVVDQDNQPIPNAAVVLDSNHSVRTDEKGKFDFTGLELGRYDVQITANGYEDYKQEVALSRTFFNYQNRRIFQLQATSNASLKGKLISPDSGYAFLDDRILMAGEQYIVKPDGTFEIPDLETGDQIFIFQSANYIDETREIKLEPGANELGEIKLSPAGDIVGDLHSWVRNDIVADLGITVEGVADAQLEVADAGTFKIKDLEISREYKIRTQKQGYETRDYTIDIEQGENELFEFRVVEAGFVPFLREVDRDLQVFVANFDGKNERKLTSGTTEPYAEYISGDQVYYLSTRDNARSELSGEGFIAYVANITGGNPQRLTANTNRLGRVVPNFNAKLLANVREGEEDEHRVLEVMDLTGNSRQQVEYLDSEIPVINDIVISDNGKYIFYYMQDKPDSINGLYRAEIGKGEGQRISTQPNIQIYTASGDGNKVLYTTTNAETGLGDLRLYTVSTGQDTLVRRSYTGSQYQFVKGSDNLLLFFDYRDGGSNMYMLDLQKNVESRLTKFSDTEGVEAVYQLTGFVFYQTNRGLYVMDVDQPVEKRLVTSNLQRYTGYDF